MREKPIKATEVNAKKGQSFYPEPFAAQVAGRTKRKLGDVFGLTHFGVNLTHLEPGAADALFHHHSLQDEFIFILEGTPTLRFGDEEYDLGPGDCMGFKHGMGIGHQLINRSSETVAYVEIGDRTPGDVGEFPNDDIIAKISKDGSWIFLHRDGEPY